METNLEPIYNTRFLKKMHIPAPHFQQTFPDMNYNQFVELQLPEKYKQNFEVLSEGATNGMH